MYFFLYDDDKVDIFAKHSNNKVGIVFKLVRSNVLFICIYNNENLSIIFVRTNKKQYRHFSD